MCIKEYYIEWNHHPASAIVYLLMGSLFSSIAPFTFPFCIIETNPGQHILLKIFQYVSLNENSFIFYIITAKILMPYSFFLNKFCLNPGTNKIHTFLIDWDIYLGLF